jgi:uncharacterized protein involved in tolerance to divalent cations
MEIKNNFYFWWKGEIEKKNQIEKKIRKKKNNKKEQG